MFYMCHSFICFFLLSFGLVFSFVPYFLFRLVCHFLGYSDFSYIYQTRLQAQAAGFAYSHPLSNMTSRMACFGPNMLFADLKCSPSCNRAGIHGTVSLCPPECFRYKGTLDVICKIIQQEGFARLWRGTNAGLVLAIPSVGI